MANYAGTKKNTTLLFCYCIQRSQNKKNEGLVDKYANVLFTQRLYQAMQFSSNIIRLHVQACF